MTDSIAKAYVGLAESQSRAPREPNKWPPGSSRWPRGSSKWMEHWLRRDGIFSDPSINASNIKHTNIGLTFDVNGEFDTKQIRVKYQPQGDDYEVHFMEPLGERGTLQPLHRERQLLPTELAHTIRTILPKRREK